MEHAKEDLQNLLVHVLSLGMYFYRRARERDVFGGGGGFLLNSKHPLQADKAKKLSEIQMMKHRALNTLLHILVCHCVTYLHSHSVSHGCEAVSL